MLLLSSWSNYREVVFERFYNTFIFDYCRGIITLAVDFSRSFIVDIYDLLNPFPSYQHTILMVTEIVKLEVSLTCSKYLVQHISFGFKFIICFSLHNIVYLSSKLMIGLDFVFMDVTMSLVSQGPSFCFNPFDKSL